MGTRAILIVKEKDSNEAFHIYRHWDGYPDEKGGVLSDLEKVVNSNLVWALPRYEADEFASGIIACLKQSDGNYRLLNSHPGDIGQEFEYHISCENGVLRVDYKDENDKAQTKFIKRTVSKAA